MPSTIREAMSSDQSKFVDPGNTSGGSLDSAATRRPPRQNHNEHSQIPNRDRHGKAPCWNARRNARWFYRISRLCGEPASRISRRGPADFFGFHRLEILLPSKVVVTCRLISCSCRLLHRNQTHVEETP